MQCGEQNEGSGSQMGQVLVLTWHVKLVLSTYFFKYGRSDTKRWAINVTELSHVKRKLVLCPWIIGVSSRVTTLVLNFLQQSFLVLAACLKRFRQPSANYWSGDIICCKVHLRLSWHLSRNIVAAGTIFTFWTFGIKILKRHRNNLCIIVHVPLKHLNRQKNTKTARKIT